MFKDVGHFLLTKCLYRGYVSSVSGMKSGPCITFTLLPCWMSFYHGQILIETETDS